jgi:hypothetical protein
MRTYHQARFGEGHLVLVRNGTVIKHRSNKLSDKEAEWFKRVWFDLFALICSEN